MQILAVVGTGRYSLESLWDKGALGKDGIRNKNSGPTQNTRNQFPATQRLTWQEILGGNRNHKRKDRGPRRRQI